MNPDEILVLALIAATFLLLVTELVRVDVIALLVMGALALTRLVTPSEALSGFSSPAVVTIWAVFILSGALSRSGVASRIGSQMLRLAGDGEMRLIAGIMLTAGLMSAFINNVGATALLLPVVMDIARRTKRSPSRLLIPLASGSLLGGMITLIGTPANLLINDVLIDLGHPQFRLFDFAPLGLASLLAGVLVTMFITRHLLPVRNLDKESVRPFSDEIDELFDVNERMFVLNIIEGSALVGKTMLESRLGAALGINVIAIFREGEPLRSPGPEFSFRARDQLVVEGELSLLESLQSEQLLVPSQKHPNTEDLYAAGVALYEVTIGEDSILVGKTLFDIDFRDRFPVNVLAIRSRDRIQRTNLQNRVLEAGDALLMQVPAGILAKLKQADEWVSVHESSKEELNRHYPLNERLQYMSVPKYSSLVGLTLAESRLADAFGVSVLTVHRMDGTVEFPHPQLELMAGDELLVEIWPEDWKVLHGLIQLEIKSQPELLPDLDELQSERIGITEVVLSPHTTFAGKTLRELHFREKFGLNVIAIWRGGRPYRSHLRDMALRFGDALLLHGPRSRLDLLNNEQDFIVLAGDSRQPYHPEKAPLSILIMALVLAAVLFEVLPIAIAAVIGSALMVLTGILTMEDAYRFIDWKSVFLIAGMFPLGIAMQNTGVADTVAKFAVDSIGVYGPSAVIAALFLLTCALTQIMPNPAAAVLMIPIALGSALQLGLSPVSFAMVVALAASSSYLTPIGHPANSLVMGPGGYRFSDYTRSGILLVVCVLLIATFLLPYVWPL